MRDSRPRNLDLRDSSKVLLRGESVMSRKLLILSSVFVALVAVSFDTSNAEAARCCRSRGRCCHRGYGGHGHGSCGAHGGYAGCHTGCNVGCNVAWNGGCNAQVAVQGCAVQPCSLQVGCPVQGRLIAQPVNPATAAPAPPPESGAQPNEPLAPANVSPAAPPPAPGT